MFRESTQSGALIPLRKIGVILREPWRLKDLPFTPLPCEPDKPDYCVVSDTRHTNLPVHGNEDSVGRSFNRQGPLRMTSSASQRHIPQKPEHLNQIHSSIRFAAWPAGGTLG